MKRSGRAISLLACGMAVSALLDCPDALAQVAAGSHSGDLRPIYATTDEVADGKQFAEASCAGCHGTNGISSTTGIPNLAGQRPSYLLLQLKAYQTGSRINAAMNTAVKFISDDALVKVSAYYASLDPAQPGPARRQAMSTRSKAARPPPPHAPAAMAKRVSASIPTIPSLVGQDPQYLMAAMKAYRSGQRKNDTMQPMLAAASDADISHLALFYALQPAARAQTPAAGDAQAGKAAAAGCAGCHGDQGVSGSPTTPSLAGQDAQYIVAALEAYKSGARADETMKALAAGIDDSALANVAAYYAGLEPKTPNVRPPLSAAEWTDRCDRCHGLKGNSTDPRIPALAAQRTEYLQASLHNFQAGTRISGEMAAMASVLSEEDVKNLATYYSHQNARAVVFMPAPNK